MLFAVALASRTIPFWHTVAMINSLPPEMLVRILDTLPVRIFWKDLNSRFLGCNALFASDAGVSDPSEFVGRSDFYFYAPEQANAFRADDADIMHTKTPKLGILEKLTKADGRVIWLETNKWPLIDTNGHVSGILGMYRDITQAKFDEDERCRACLSTMATLQA